VALNVIGFEAHAVSAKDAERLAVGGKAWRWRAAPELVERLRVSKTAAEVTAVRAAAELAGDALRATLMTFASGKPNTRSPASSRGTCDAWGARRTRSRPSLRRAHAPPGRMRAPAPSRWREGIGCC
jgi:hypothetical protein